VGGCTRRVQTAWLSLALHALEIPWLALSGPLLSSYAQMGRENSPLALHDAHFWLGSLCQLSVMTIASSLMGLF